MNPEAHANDLSQLIIDQTPDAVIFAGADGVIQVWNPAAATIFGHSAGEAIGQSLDLIIPERFREAHWQAFDAAIAAGRTRLAGKPLPTRSMRKDGSTIYVELSFAIVKDASGAVLGALAQARDITERWLADRAKQDASAS